MTKKIIIMQKNIHVISKGRNTIRFSTSWINTGNVNCKSVKSELEIDIMYIKNNLAISLMYIHIYMVPMYSKLYLEIYYALSSKVIKIWCFYGQILSSYHKLKFIKFIAFWN